jgi:energy-coupling factor transporter transmembrane protein EcfT
MLDYDSRLLFVTGFWAITFLVACLVFIILPLSMPGWFKIDEWISGPPFILSAIFLAITSTAFAFYIRYVGKVPLSFYITFKVVLVCLLPLIILIILYKYRSMKRLIVDLHEREKYSDSKSGESAGTGEEKEINILQDSKSENLRLNYRNIVAVKSADNYFEIYYLEQDRLEKKLIRGTLKNIESRLSEKDFLIRCHRTSIVNVDYIEKLVRNYSGYHLKMTLLEETIPVSRQYLIRVKTAISAGK